ncbi:hypothetical protein SLEP1_g33864 [Rubroshorea leprosula]|uniref:BED-type domain-containing protein n=1 Tax=Rubroshorea leprosula TaxID=152421 RepID=A0AAV5KI31_9ROSI|nr:hypothetical protein SLEP1_g33864 [Rubroshorea leprosula]
MSRFNDAVLKVSSFDQAVEIAAVISGLKHDRFRDSLIKHAATTFSEVNDRSLKFITAEEYALVQNPPPTKNQHPDWRDDNPSRKRMRMAQNRDHGHTTEQCNSLKSELERLAMKGMLNEYVQRAKQPRFIREQRPQPQGVRNPPNRQGVGYQQAPPPLPPPARIIHMITGGLEAGGLSSKQRKLYKYDGPIYGFNNQLVPVEGVLTLHVAFGSGRTYVTPSVRFLSHLCMKFPTPTGIATLRGNQEVARYCYITSVTQPMKGKDPTPEAIPQPISDNQQVMGVEIVDNRPEDETRAAPVEDVEEVLIDNRDPSRKTQIGTRLNPEERAELIAFLRANNDVFAWTSADMPGIPKSVIKEKVEKLLQAGFIRKVDYCEWVANPVLVKRANGKWRMCIDYTNLNQACPKDCYPMPSIDKLVEAASGNERLSLLDAYSGYHQVPMAPEDEEKTSFYAGDEIYCYVMMPFGLKNAGATYQKMVTIVFRAQIGKNLEVYVDDIVVKSRKAEDHLVDLDETFNNLRKNRMQLNPAKCIFGVESGKFLGFMVSRKGIEVNPEKIRAIADMEPPKSVKDIQRLTGRVAALHRFISKSADKCLPFFKIMRSAAQKDESGKQKKFEWSQECQTAFDELKSYLSLPPLLTKAIDGEILYLYLGISDEAISSVLVREETKQHKPIYYISSVLHGAELRYPIAEKATLAVVTSARKLRPYFQSYPIIVLTDQPLRQILQKPECSGRLIKWAVELGEFELTFQQRSAIRAQALADFIVECTPCPSTSNPEPNDWTLYVDGASSSKGSGAGALLIGPEGYRSEHALKFNFDATNNMAEYEALLLGLQLALELKSAISVLKLGPDRLVEPVEPSPGHENGPNAYPDPVRRSNRPNPPEPPEPPDSFSFSNSFFDSKQIAKKKPETMIPYLFHPDSESHFFCSSSDLHLVTIAKVVLSLDPLRPENFSSPVLFRFSSFSRSRSLSGSSSTVRPEIFLLRFPSGPNTDAAWEHCVEVVEGTKKSIKCLHCQKAFRGGGINRIKQHLAGKGGDVRKCNKVPFDVRYRMQQSLKEIEESKKQAKNVWEENPFGHCDEDAPDLQEIPNPSTAPQSQVKGKGLEISANKKRKASGIENYFAPRATPGAQPSIRSVLAGKDALHNADLAIARELVEFVGSDNVVHLVTDNAANYKKAGRLLNDIYPTIFWSPCAAHCLNLILSDIGKLEVVSNLASRASLVSKFIYNHPSLLAWLRKREGWAEIIRPGPTCFATTFIALKSIHEHRHDLQALVTSLEFKESRYYKDHKANDVVAVVLDKKFWNNCELVVKIVGPLIRLLRIVDGDERPSLGYVYDGMYRARKAIKTILMNRKSLYKPYTRLIKGRWDRQLRQNLHAAAYYLNLAFFYDKESFSTKKEVMNGFMDVVDAKVPSRRNDNKRKTCFDPIDYESIENVEEWVMEEDESPILDYDELENIIYNDKTMPICHITQKEGGTHDINEEVQGGEEGSFHIGSASGGIDLESIGEENDDSYDSENDFHSLSKFASDSSLSSRSVFVEILDEPSSMKPRVMEISTNPDTPNWTNSIISFLQDGIAPEDRQEAMKLRKKASRYTLVDGVLYKRSFSLPLLRCLNLYEAEYALREVHEGVCGSHVGARTLAHKVLRQGYYWPNMHKDATYFVQKCPKCQFFTHLTHQPAEELTNLVAPWSFAQWGMDLLGPFIKGVGGVTHLIWDPESDCGR